MIFLIAIILDGAIVAVLGTIYLGFFSYEIAFLDIMPCAEGHTLVIPKLEVKRLEDLPESEALSLMRTMQHVAKAVSTAFV